MWDIVRNIIIAFLSLIVLYWINKSVQSKKGVEDELGSLHFTLTPIYKWVGIFCLIIFTVIGIAAFVDSKTNWIISLLFILFLGGVSVIIIISYQKIFFEMDEEEIRFRGIINPVTCIKWNEIERIKFSVWSSSIVFINKKGKKVRAHAHLQGITQIIAMIEKKKGLTKQDIKFPY